MTLATRSLLSWVCFFALQGLLVAQEIDSVVESELQRLPWIDSDTVGSKVVFKDLSHQRQGEAATNDRFDVPRRKKKAQAAATTPTTTTPSDLSWIQTTIWVILSVIVLAILAALLWIFFKMESSRTSATKTLKPSEDFSERVKHLPFQLEGQLDGDFRSQAAAAAKRGDFGRATMLLFSHILISLDQKGLIKLKKGKTNRQYLLELAQHRHLTNYYEDVMIPFEDHFFGSHTIEERRFLKYWNNLDQFLNDVNDASSAPIL